MAPGPGESISHLHPLRERALALMRGFLLVNGTYPRTGRIFARGFLLTLRELRKGGAGEN